MALALLVVMLGAISAWDRALLRTSRSPRAIEIQASGPAMVVLANGERVPVRAVRGAGVTRQWVALVPVSLKGHSAMVTTGMLGAPGARLLRLWALWGRTASVASGQRLP